jgi:hypothetical protein
MEDVLEVYTRPYDERFPQVCLDEKSKQLVGEVREPLAVSPGHPARYDYEYERNGTANLFIVSEPLAGWRHISVTERLTKLNWAHCVKELVLQCHINLGCELSASLAVPERLYYPLPEAFLAPLAVASIHRPPWPELLFGQIPPRSTGSEDPKHPREYLTMIAAGGRPVGGFSGGISGLMRSHCSSVGGATIGSGTLPVACLAVGHGGGASSRRRARRAV